MATTSSTVLLPYRRLALLVDNSSMNGPASGTANVGKNDNLYSEKTVQAVSVGFENRCFGRNSTGLLICPEDERYGTPVPWLERCLSALVLLKGEQPKVEYGARIKERIKGLLERDSSCGVITWRDALAASDWDFNRGGKPNKEFIDLLPRMITIQGQNRAAMAISVFASDWGIDKSRGGRHGNTALFENDESGERSVRLKASLSAPGAVIMATVNDYMGYEEAAKQGRDTHDSAQGSRKPGVLAAAIAGGRLVKQAWRPEENICPALAEEVLGKNWRKKLHPPPGLKGQRRKSADQTMKRLQEKIRDFVKSKFKGVGNLFKFKGNALLTLVYGGALKPDALIIELMFKRLLLEDEQDMRHRRELALADEEGGMDEYDRDVETQKSVRANDDTSEWKTNLSNRTTAPAVLQLFGVTERVQRRMEEPLLAQGMVNSVKRRAEALARTDLIVAMVRSLLLGRQTTGDVEELRNLGGAFCAMGGIVENGEALSCDDIETVLRFTETSFERFVNLESFPSVDKKLLKRINKTPLKAELSRMYGEASEGVHGVFSPGYGNGEPYLTTAQPEIRFDVPMWTAWDRNSDNEKDKRLRRMATDFSVLVAERAMANHVSSNAERSARALQTFKRVFSNLDQKGILFEIIGKDPHVLDYNNQTFFDEARLHIIETIAAKRPGKAKEKVPKANSKGTSKQQGGPKAKRQGGPKAEQQEQKHNVKINVMANARTTECTAYFPPDLLTKFSLTGTDGKLIQGRTVASFISTLGVGEEHAKEKEEKEEEYDESEEDSNVDNDDKGSDDDDDDSRGGGDDDEDMEVVVMGDKESDKDDDDGSPGGGDDDEDEEVVVMGDKESDKAKDHVESAQLAQDERGDSRPGPKRTRNRDDESAVRPRKLKVIVERLEPKAKKKTTQPQARKRQPDSALRGPVGKQAKARRLRVTTVVIEEAKAEFGTDEAPREGHVSNFKCRLKCD